MYGVQRPSESVLQGSRCPTTRPNTNANVKHKRSHKPMTDGSPGSPNGRSQPNYVSPNPPQDLDTVSLRASAAKWPTYGLPIPPTPRPDLSGNSRAPDKILDENKRAGGGCQHSGPGCPPPPARPSFAQDLVWSPKVAPQILRAGGVGYPERPHNHNTGNPPLCMRRTAAPAPDVHATTRHSLRSYGLDPRGTDWNGLEPRELRNLNLYSRQV